MALNHVAQRTRGVIKSCAIAHAQHFSIGNLHVVYVLIVPNRFKHGISKALQQNILQGRFT